jgi:hypothetical protein
MQRFQSSFSQTSRVGFSNIIEKGFEVVTLEAIGNFYQKAYTEWFRDNKKASNIDSSIRKNVAVSDDAAILDLENGLS